MDFLSSQQRMRVTLTLVVLAVSLALAAMQTRAKRAVEAARQASTPALLFELRLRIFMAASIPTHASLACASKEWMVAGREALREKHARLALSRLRPPSQVPPVPVNAGLRGLSVALDDAFVVPGSAFDSTAHWTNGGVRLQQQQRQQQQQQLMCRGVVCSISNGGL